MSQTLLISGPPGCGKTTWILNRIQSHPGPCGFLRLAGYPDEGLLQARDGGIDLADPDQSLAPRADNLLALIELPQFQPPTDSGLAGVDRRAIPQLEALHLSPDAHLHFGRDAVLPRQDTLDFSSLQAWERNLAGAVWDPASLSSFWFELVNGAYGDVYRAKALMNLPDGRAFFCNWMVSREGSQFLPLQTLASPDGRPQRLSRLVVQGKDLDPAAIEVTLADCLHANLAALEAVLADIDQQGIATITCLGDLVGYGPQPNEVVDLVRQRAIPTCQGCWDEDIIEARSGQQFRLELSGGGIESQVRDLEGQRHHQQSVPQRQVIGIGAGVHYTLYDPGSDRLDFLLAGCKPKQRRRGFA